VSFFDVSASFTIVIVPVTMSAAANGCANLTFEATPQVTSSVGTLNMEVTPGLTAELTASVGVGTAGFSAGVEANVTLLNFELPITLNPSYNFSTSDFSYATTGQMTLSMLDGSLDLYAKVDLGIWDKEYTYNLLEWDGLIEKTWYLWANGEPSAGDVKGTISTSGAVGSYTYADTADIPEGTSTYAWFRNSVASDTGRIYMDGGTSSADKTHPLEDYDIINTCNFASRPKTQQEGKGLRSVRIGFTSVASCSYSTKPVTTRGTPPR
jgi:hypothetical protein